MGTVRAASRSSDRKASPGRIHTPLQKCINFHTNTNTDTATPLARTGITGMEIRHDVSCGDDCRPAWRSLPPLSLQHLDSGRAARFFASTRINILHAPTFTPNDLDFVPLCKKIGSPSHLDYDNRPLAIPDWFEFVSKSKLGPFCFGPRRSQKL